MTKYFIYLQDMITHIRDDVREEFDEFIHVTRAFYEMDLIDDMEFKSCFNFLVDALKDFGVTREEIADMFVYVPN